MSCVSESYTRRVFPHVFRVFLSVSPLILLLQSYNCACWINSVLAALVFRFVFFDFECFGADYRNGFMSKMHYQKRTGECRIQKSLRRFWILIIFHSEKIFCKICRYHPNTFTDSHYNPKIYNLLSVYPKQLTPKHP